jgi:DNA-binding transcriptional ArsR family regulator
MLTTDLTTKPDLTAKPGATELTQSNVSGHLTYLRDCGLVASRQNLGLTALYNLDGIGSQS